MINTVTIAGRFTADPELKHTQMGVSVLSFSLAVDDDYVKPGEERKADFIEFQAWKGTAEWISKYFQKGSQILLRGELKTNSWVDKEGKNRKSTFVKVDKAYFFGGKNNSEQVGTPSAYETLTAPSSTADDDDELPF